MIIPLILVVAFVFFIKKLLEKNDLIIKNYILKNTRESKLHIIDLLSLGRMSFIKNWLISEHSLDKLEMIKLAAEDEFKRKENFASRAAFINLITLPFFSAAVTFLVPLFTFIFGLTSFGIQQEYIKETRSNPSKSFFEFFDIADPANNQLDEILKAIINSAYFRNCEFLFKMFLYIILILGVCLLIRRFSLRTTSRLYIITKQAYEEKLKKVEEFNSHIKEMKMKLALNWDVVWLNDSKENLELILISPDKTESYIIESTEEQDIIKIKSLIKNMQNKFN
ncbi:hypothetical protein M3596_22360 [Bacillus subtilis]|uniref:hypothetical protein n=1 Tax=Bacillus subtilis TaxID=1423 RepID=UPI00203E2686|nr:hypothetical protein [Bacillus subtilis]MCM3191451.1 hypothetical protein [Bacillus subtilis]